MGIWDDFTKSLDNLGTSISSKAIGAAASTVVSTIAHATGDKHAAKIMAKITEETVAQVIMSTRNHSKDTTQESITTVSSSTTTTMRYKQSSNVVGFEERTTIRDVSTGDVVGNDLQHIGSVQNLIHGTAYVHEGEVKNPHYSMEIILERGDTRVSLGFLNPETVAILSPFEQDDIVNIGSLAEYNGVFQGSKQISVQIARIEKYISVNNSGSQIAHRQIIVRDIPINPPPTGNKILTAQNKNAVSSKHSKFKKRVRAQKKGRK